VNAVGDELAPFQVPLKPGEEEVDLQSLPRLKTGNPLPIPAQRENVSIDLPSGKIGMSRLRLCVRKEWETLRLPGVWVSRPERFRTGRKKASLKTADDENDQVVLTPMPPMCWLDGNKAARMAYKFTGRSKNRDTREGKKPPIVS
jgi:hypothetical protein